jgi:hypothetical protein
VKAKKGGKKKVKNEWRNSKISGIRVVATGTLS